MAKVRDVIEAMERLAPPWLALDGDPIGLHAGEREREVKRVAVALDASVRSLAEAAAMKADMLVVHHPRFYRGLSTLSADDPSGRRAAEIIQSGLAVYSAHTNFDMAENGTNDELARLAGLENAELISPEKTERLIKLAVFVPESHVDDVRRALDEAGAGAIGKYSGCTFRMRGTGTFRCGEDCNPFIGRPGSFEEIDEYRLETVFGEFSAARIVAAMIAAHPYEEVAYDLYPLLGQARRFGFGRVGDMAKAESLSGLAGRMAKLTGSAMAQYCGRAAGTVRRVAVWAGAGVEAKAFLRCGADAVVAGEVGYHELETFVDAGIAVVTLGHGHSERPALKWLAKRMSMLLPQCETRLLKPETAVMRNV